MKTRRGFTLVEFMVLFGIFVILLSIFFPYLLKVREADRRAQCASNLKQIGDALSLYANANQRNFPRVIYDEVSMPTGYNAFSGPDDDNPFAPESKVQPNDVTASLWLLVRQGWVSPAAFICPGSKDSRDLMTDSAGRFVKPTQRGNFRKPSNLSYSYASPFSNALNFKLNFDYLNFYFALVADKNPGIGPEADVTKPPYNADPIELSRANSFNHGRAGQNVLYPNGGVTFRRTPYAGPNYGEPHGDNIYTARAPVPATQPANLHVTLNGYCGTNLSPVTPDDSYLVPTAQDDASPSRVPPPATAPASTTPATTTEPPPAPTTAPATAPTQPATTTGS
ncbi:MAG: type II secretion system protein [Anaerolineae bacterium]|nr:type II secretion system protein [Phycisphaerae bacterium]